MENLFIIVAVIGVCIFYYLIGLVPYSIAKRNNHPYTKAIKWLGLLGLLVGIVWFGALVWAICVRDKELPSTSGMLNQKEKNIKEYMEWKRKNNIA